MELGSGRRHGSHGSAKGGGILDTRYSNERVIVHALEPTYNRGENCKTDYIQLSE